MKTLASAIALALLSSAALAQTPSGGMAPTNSAATNSASPSSNAAPPKEFTVTDYYKQTVYDRQDNTIGKVDDILIDKGGNISSLIIGVGGFLGVGQKDVAVKFQDVQLTSKNNKWYLHMNADKETLKSAQSLKYDNNTTTWVADNSSNSSASNTSNGTVRR